MTGDIHVSTSKGCSYICMTSLLANQPGFRRIREIAKLRANAIEIIPPLTQTCTWTYVMRWPLLPGACVWTLLIQPVSHLCWLAVSLHSARILPIGIGETSRRIIAKAVLAVTRCDIQDAAGSLQLCAGQIAGISCSRCEGVFSQ